MTIRIKYLVIEYTHAVVIYVRRMRAYVLEHGSMCECV